ncbi:MULTISPECIES: nuclear transport factor 2 family protein [Acinetobacter]|uniref:nuclear transport factor 2 family protein n=1 Tax=Acinetobacter TaxID=469 RepID=UPI000D004D84|nr:nuclear transport factor 2 family protein [Acinetobacter sp. MYb10]QLD63383.1 nuclear transport factor 2 family protein [Acinetobacter sp. MYb10]
MAKTLEDIQQLIQLYFDGLYNCDIAKLQQIFHAKACYVSAVESPLVILTMSEYFAIVEKRISPSSLKQVRKDKICSIQILSETTAVVSLECVIEPKYFYDVLTLVFNENRWWIISKVFHYKLLGSDDNSSKFATACVF